MSSNPNNPLLSEACGIAHTQIREILNQQRALHHDSPEGLRVYQEIEDFLEPRLLQLEKDMKAAESVEAQKELLLQLMRHAFNEEMMVSGRPEVFNATDSYIRNVSKAYAGLVRENGQGHFASKTDKIKDPGATFHTLHMYQEQLYNVAHQVGFRPATHVRQEHRLPWGPVKDEQRVMLIQESEAILREMGAPLVTKDMPFQPDMLAVVMGLLMAPDHMAQLMKGMQHGPLDENADPPKITMKKWERIQRDYPNMATSVTEMMAAAAATQGRSRTDLH